MIRGGHLCFRMSRTVAGYRLQHASAMHSREFKMSSTTPASHFNLDWGRSTPNNRTNPRFLIPRYRKSYRGQTNFKRVTESILHRVKKVFRHQTSGNEGEMVRAGMRFGLVNPFFDDHLTVHRFGSFARRAPQQRLRRGEQQAMG